MIVCRTKEEVGTTRVRKHLVVVVCYISKREDVKLRFASASSDVDRKQDREGDAAANQTSDNSHLQQTQEQVAVQRVVVQDITIGNIEEVAEPSKESIRQFR